MRAEKLELQVEHGLEQTGVDASTESGPLAPQECRRDSARQMDRGDHVGDGDSHRDGRVVDAAVQPGQAGQRLRKQILSWTVLPRSFAAVAGDTGVDDARVDRLDSLVAKTEPLHDPR